MLEDKTLGETLTPGSNKKVSWVCEHGHVWVASVYSVVTSGTGCPYCSGRLPIVGETDLATTNPEIAAQLVDESLATSLCRTSGRKVAWRCDKGHVWEASVASRVSIGSRCPYCSNRRVLAGYNDLATTHPEVAAQLVDPSLASTVTAGSKKVLSWKCERGHVWDAAVSKRVRAHDKEHATGCPYCAGKKVLAGFNDLATTHPDIAAMCVDPDFARSHSHGSHDVGRWRCECGHEWEAEVAYVVMTGGACPLCSKRSVRVRVGENDLGTTRPDLAAQLVDKDLAHVLHERSGRCVRWRCEHGHEWDAVVRDRVVRGFGCPYCSGKRAIEGQTDLATLRPDIAGELVDKEMARVLRPGSSKRMRWVCEKGHEWETSVYARTKPDGTRCPICSGHGTSKGERELADFVESLLPGIEVIRNDQSVLPGKYELDVVVPSLKVAFEFNGTYWHSEAAGKGRGYHRQKRELAESAGYTLYHIWQDVWELSHDAACRMVAAKLGATVRLADVLGDEIGVKACETVFARRLSCETVTGHVASQFLDANHIQGSTPATRHFALVDGDGDVRALMSVRSPRLSSRTHRPEGMWEIARYATLGHVPGGFTRLLAFAERTLLGEGVDLREWVSFSDNDVSDGSMYAKCGFTLDQELAPDYRYVLPDDMEHRRRPKEAFQRKRFRSDPDLVWDESWTESEAAEANGLWKCWDSGKRRWVRVVRTSGE